MSRTGGILALLLAFALLAQPLSAQEELPADARDTHDEAAPVDESAPVDVSLPSDVGGATVEESTPPAAEATPVPSPTSLTPAAIAARIAPSVVQVLRPDGSGSGVKVAEGVLTNNHVVEGAKSLELVANDGRRAAARVLRTDPSRDLALLQTSLDLPSAQTEPSALLKQGDEVLVFGYPLGMGGQVTLTRGLVSANRSVGDVSFLQTDAAVNPGNSGGPVVSMNGKVVGITTWRVAQAEGLGFAVTSEAISAFLGGAPAIANSPLIPPAPTPTPRFVRSVLDLAIQPAEIGAGFTTRYTVTDSATNPDTGASVQVWDRQFLDAKGDDRSITIFVFNAIELAVDALAKEGQKLNLPGSTYKSGVTCLTNTYICQTRNVFFVVWRKDALDTKIVDTLLGKIEANAR